MSKAKIDNELLEQAKQMALLLIEQGYSALKAEIKAMEDHRDPRQTNQTPISQTDESDPRDSLNESSLPRTAESSFLAGKSLSSLSLNEIMALIRKEHHPWRGDDYDLQNYWLSGNSKLEKHPWNSVCPI